jgi:hypothetical protein
MTVLPPVQCCMPCRHAAACEGMHRHHHTYPPDEGLSDVVPVSQGRLLRTVSGASRC